MNGSRINTALAVTALMVSTGLTAAWVGGWVVDTAAWPVRAGLPVVALTLAGGATALALRQQRRQRSVVGRHLAALCRLDPQSAYSDGACGELPPLPADNPWRETTDQLRTTILASYRRLRDLEHDRTSLEVRCRRATDRADQMRQILSGLSDPILAIDDYDEVVLANRSARELFHIDAEKTETRALAQLVRCQKLVQLLTSTRQRRTAVHRTDELEIDDGEGRARWYRASAVKLVTNADNGKNAPVAAGAVAVLHDIGDQKALQKRNAEFVSAVSHEMKTPLAGIKAYVELLADGDAEDEQTQEEFLNVISGQADRLQRLVDNLLNLARIEAGVVNVSKQQRSLNEFLEEALRVVQPSAEAKNVELVSDLSPLYLSVLADRDMLLQAAINLLSNAIKYTKDGGRVTLRSRLADDQVAFEVQDTGVGLSEEDSQRVFEKFYRVQKDKNMASGTGLGLPLAKHIVEDVHGGRLAVESVLGQGSTFVVTLPCAGQMQGEG